MPLGQRELETWAISVCWQKFPCNLGCSAGSILWLHISPFRKLENLVIWSAFVFEHPFTGDNQNIRIFRAFNKLKSIMVNKFLDLILAGLNSK